TSAECTSTSYITPWATVIAMFSFYLLALFWFCKHGKSVCLPAPDSIYPYKKRLKFLKRELAHLLVDDMFIELTDSKLGQGAVGFVFKGYVFPRTQTRFKQKVFAAVKMSYPMPQKSMGLLEEAYRMSKLDHPHIVKLIAVSKLSFQAFRPMIAMEWLPGGSLAEYFREQIRKRGNDAPPVYVRDIVDILRQVGEALKYLHESRDAAGNEASHGDVAARNVLLTSTKLQCKAKLGDFGLPLDFGPRLPIPWLPPEIVSCLDRTRIQHRPESDVWMFGVLGWECATLGAEPHYQRTVDEIQQCFTWPDRGLHRPPSCPLDFWNFLLDCMSEQHRRPRFAGPTDTVSSAIYRLRILQLMYERNDHTFEIYYNTSNCTCHQHRCNVPLPSFSGR
uniref:Protein kinase domain-containing protein n=3 Tax=Parascaris univalens TaxID=6257 RepID=A0A915B9V7_PARUN